MSGGTESVLLRLHTETTTTCMVVSSDHSPPSLAWKRWQKASRLSASFNSIRKNTRSSPRQLVEAGRRGSKMNTMTLWKANWLKEISGCADATDGGSV